MTVRGLACAMWCLAIGCAATPGPARPAAAGAETAAVLRWALGVKHRAPQPRRADVYVLRHAIAPAAPPRDAPPACFRAQAFLPARDGRIFYVEDGRVLVGDAAGSPPKPLAGPTPIHVTQLLAFAKQAAPTRLLVAGRPSAGVGEIQIWVLTVQGEGVVDARLASAEPALRSKQAFFAAYTTPRCLQGDADCLLLSIDHAQAYLDKEPTRDADPVELAKLGEMDVRDAVWADATSLLLLVGCPAGPM
jgi:hypothetical protein